LGETDEREDVNRCKLTECLGKPRCKTCLAMDAAYPTAAPADVAALQARLDDALFVLGMVDKNNRIDAGEKGKAWSGRFVADEVRRVLSGAPKVQP
jgi:hypothetical protein